MSQINAIESSNGSVFPTINAGYNAVFKPSQLSIGLVLPLENYTHYAVPTMREHIERVQLAEELGFLAVWLRDIPFNVPTFGDAGQVFDPFVYLGLLAGQTERIALGVASIILPLRHPAHVAKAAASVDVLSNGRLILGIASGDRPEEYPALNIPFEDRSQRFRESCDYIRQLGEESASIHNSFGCVSPNIEMLPKPVASKLPLLVTGSSQQTPAWVASNSDGWMTFPRPIAQQAQLIEAYRSQARLNSEYDKPVIEPLYIDLLDKPNVRPEPIHLGWRMGVKQLRDYLQTRRSIGVNHVCLNLRFNQQGIDETLHRLADEGLAEFLM